MVKDAYHSAASGNIEPKNIPNSIKHTFMRLDGTMFGSSDPTQCKQFETEAFAQDHSFLGNKFNVENGVLAIVAYDQGTSKYATYVTKDSPELRKELEQSGFSKERKIGVPHVYNLNLFPYTSGREDISAAYKESDNFTATKQTIALNSDQKLQS